MLNFDQEERRYPHISKRGVTARSIARQQRRNERPRYQLPDDRIVEKPDSSAAKGAISRDYSPKLTKKSLVNRIGGQVRVQEVARVHDIARFRRLHPS